MNVFGQKSLSERIIDTSKANVRDLAMIAGTAPVKGGVEYLGRKEADVSLDGKKLTVGKRQINFEKKFKRMGEIREIVDTATANGRIVYAVCDFGIVGVPKDKAEEIVWAATRSKLSFRRDTLSFSDVYACPCVTLDGYILDASKKKFIFITDSAGTVKFKKMGGSFKHGISSAVFTNATFMKDYDQNVYIGDRSLMLRTDGMDDVVFDTKSNSATVFSFELKTYYKLR